MALRLRAAGRVGRGGRGGASSGVAKAVAACGVLCLGLVSLPARAEDVPTSDLVSFQGLYDVSVVAAPVRVAYTRPFLFDPVVNAQVFPASAAVNSVGSRQGSASLVGLGAAETAGGLLPQLIPSSLDDVVSEAKGLAGLLGLPLPDVPLPPLPSVPFPVVPLPPAPPPPNTVNSNYPFTSDASTGGGSVGAAPVFSGHQVDAETHARANSVFSYATGTDVSSQLLGPTGLISIGGMTSAARTDVRADGVVGTGTSTLSNINILGLVTIDSLVSTTEVRGDGRSSESISTVKIGNVKALGYPATIDSDGVKIADNGVVPGSVVDSLNKQLAAIFTQAGLRVALVENSRARAEADATSTATSQASSLMVDYQVTPPSDLPAVGGTFNDLEVDLGYSEGAIMTGPVFGGGEDGNTPGGDISGVTGPGGGGATGGSSTGPGVGGVDGLSGLGAVSDTGSSGGLPAIAGSSPDGGGPLAAGPGSSQAGLGSRATVLASDGLRWATIWPLVLGLTIVAAFGGNFVWSRRASGLDLAARP